MVLMKRLFLSVICMMSLLASWAQTTADARISQALNSSDWFELQRVFQGADKDSVRRRILSLILVQESMLLVPRQPRLLVWMCMMSAPGFPV